LLSFPSLDRYIYGNKANEHMNVEELYSLERYLEIWMCNIRSAKVIHRQNLLEILREVSFQTFLKHS
jgi:hypothetical protein